MAVGGATHLPPPRSGNSVAGGPRLLIRQALPAYLAANLNIWRPSHYPPPVDAVGSLQFGPNECVFILSGHRPVTSDWSSNRKAGNWAVWPPRPM